MTQGSWDGEERVTRRRCGRLRAGVMTGLVVTAVAGPASRPAAAWGTQGHRVVGQVAETRLSADAQAHVHWLLDGRSLGEVGSWADAFVDGVYQTALWHFVNIPQHEVLYARERDCPRQPAAPAVGRGDRWRDCVVDRIEYHAARVGNGALDRADRALALKFLVHLVADVHQPFHALATARGGNGIQVEVFGSLDCPTDAGTSARCNLHSVWDAGLMRHAGLADRALGARLESMIRQKGWGAARDAGVAAWAEESHAIAKQFLLGERGRVDQDYYERAIPRVEERLALAAVRLAALLDRTLTGRPPGR